MSARRECGSAGASPSRGSISRLVRSFVRPMGRGERGPGIARPARAAQHRSGIRARGRHGSGTASCGKAGRGARTAPSRRRPAGGFPSRRAVPRPAWASRPRSAAGGRAHTLEQREGRDHDRQGRQKFPHFGLLPPSISLGSVCPHNPCAGPIRGTRRRGLRPRLEPDASDSTTIVLASRTLDAGPMRLRHAPDRRSGPLGRFRAEGSPPGFLPRRLRSQSADVWACGSATGSTGPLLSTSASEPSSNSGRFSGFIFRTSSSISLPGLNVTTFFEGT